MATAASDLDVRVRGIDELGPKFNELESRTIRFVGFISAALAGIRIGTAPIKAAADFERELADVLKTTDFTGESVKLLSDELVRLSRTTNVAVLDLAKIAAAAGQQGLGTSGVQAVIQFTDSVSRMASVLDVTAEQAGTDIGKIINVFRLPLAEVERIVSAFNEVSNGSTATGEELLDVVKRIGDATGALNLQQSLGLAASGVDFGVSPEVVGTSFSKVFAQMNSKAEEFGKLMNKSATDWIGIVQNNGIDAFRQVLARLRELEPQSQQEVIAKLIGGGRIGALINKFVQDSTDTVLNRNLAFAESGFANATSAIREQQTVLNALKEQFNVLKNNLFALGKDIGDETLEPLTNNVARLSEALKGDGFRSFAQALGRGLAGLIGTIADIIRFINDLNINWENLLRIGQLFLGLKLAQYFLKFGDAVGKSVGNLQSIANAANSATAATARLGTATAAVNASSGVGAFAARALGIQNEVKSITELIAAKRAEATARAAAAAVQVKAEQDARTAVLAAQVDKDRADRALIAANAGAGRASRPAGQASQEYRRAYQQAQQQEAQLQQRAQAALTTREAQHTATLLAIEQEYQTKRAAIRATGTEVGLKAARAERATALAEETARYERSTAAAQRYWTRQIDIARAANAQILLAQRATLGGANSALDTAVDSRSQAAAGAAAAAAALTAAKATELGVKQAGIEAAAATTKLTLFQTAVQRIGTAWTVMSGLIAAGGRVILAAFGWIALIYTVADAFGLVDKALVPLKKLGEALGLVTYESQRETLAKQASARAEEERIRKLNDAASAYDRLRDAQSQIGADPVDSINKSLDLGAKGNLEAFRRGLADTATILGGAPAKIQAMEASVQSLQKSVVTVPTEAVAAATRQVEELRKQIAAVEKPSGRREAFQLVSLRGQLADAEAALAKLTVAAKDNSKEISALQNAAGTAAADQARAQGAVVRLLTDETAKYLSDKLVPLSIENAKQLAIVERLKDANQQIQTATTEKEKENATKLFAKIQADSVATSRRIRELQTEFAQLGTTIANLTGEQGRKDAFSALREIAKLPAVQIQALDAAAKAAQAVGKKLTGDATVGARPRGGTDSFDAKDRESEARRLSRAKVEAARQASRNEINIAKARAEETQKLDQEQYDRGLIELNDYYAKRAVESTKLFNQEIKAKRDEQTQIEKELSEARTRKDPSERVRLESDLGRVRAELKVMAVQADIAQNEITAQRTRATEQFRRELLSDTARVLREGTVLATPVEVFDAALAEYTESLRKRLNELNTAAEKGDERARQTAERLKLAGVFQAVTASIDTINGAISRAFDGFDRYTQKLDLLRQAGAITSLEMREAVREQSTILAAGVQDQINNIEIELQRLTNAGAANTPAFQDKLAQLDALRLKLVDLAVTADQTAIAINRNITDSLAEGLGKLEPTLASLRNMVLSFVRDVANNIQQTIGRDLAEYITTSLGGGGSGGLGGIISRALGVSAKANPANQAGVDFANKLGSNPATPLLVRDVDNAARGILGAGQDQGDLKSLFRREELKAQKEGEGLLGSVAQAGTEFLEVIQGGLGGIGNALTSLFSGLFGGGNGGGDGLLSFIKLGASFLGVPSFHRGGIVGHAAARRFVNPAIFANAARFHDGGFPGLKPNEVPAILEEGEQVLTKRQQAASTGVGEVAIRNVLVTDPNFVPDAMATVQGERAIMTIIQRNRASIRSTVNGRG